MTAIIDVQTEGQVDLLEQALRRAEAVYFDLETTNDRKPDQAHEDWWPDSRITTASFTTEAGQSWVVPLSHPEGPWSDHNGGGPRRDGGWVQVSTRLFDAMLGAKVAGHNGKFDVRWAHSMTGVDLVDRFWWCSMTAHYVLDENEPKDLESLAKEYLDVEDWKHTAIDSHRTEEFAWQLVAEYASKDTDYGFQLLAPQREALLEEPVLGRIFSKLMMPVTRALIRMERNGLLVDHDYVLARLASCETEILEVEDHLLDEYVSDVLKETYCWKRYKTKEDKPIRPSWSPNSKFFHAFMAEAGAPVIERTKTTGAPSYSEGVMKRIASTGEYPYVDDMLRARKLGKDVGYLNSWIAKADDDHYLHPTFRPAHVATGRLSGQNPNPQQVSRHLKECFPAPDGWWFVQADYAQVELRIAAMLAHEEAMLQAFRDGRDLHFEMALRIDDDKTLHSANLFLVSAGLHADGTGAEVLSRLLRAAPPRVQPTAVLRLCGEIRADQGSRSREWWSAEGGLQPQLERWRLASSVPALSQDFLRALRDYRDALCASPGPRSNEQPSLQSRDALPVMSLIGASAATQLLPEWKGLRQRAKAPNFGFLYGMGARKFVEYAFDEYGVVFTLAEAQRIRRLFFSTWPRLGEWHEEQRLTAHTAGYVRSPLGRRRRLPDLRSKLNGKVSAAERQAVNAPVQSFASDLMLLALIELDQHPSEHRRGVGTVHDSGLYYIRGGHLKGEIAAIGEAMLYPPVKRLFGCEITVPLEVEFEVGRSWGGKPEHTVVVSTQPREELIAA